MAYTILAVCLTLGCKCRPLVYGQDNRPTVPGCAEALTAGCLALWISGERQRGNNTAVPYT